MNNRALVSCKINFYLSRSLVCVCVGGGGGGVCSLANYNVVISSRKHAYIILTPPKLHFYTVNGVYRGIHFFFILLKTHRLWVLVRTAVLRSTHDLCFEQINDKYQNFLSENFPILVVRFSMYLNRRLYVMEEFQGISLLFFFFLLFCFLLFFFFFFVFFLFFLFFFLFVCFFVSKPILIVIFFFLFGFYFIYLFIFFFFFFFFF